MNNPAFLRNLIIYAICWPLAIAAGYLAMMAAYAQSSSSFGAFGIFAVILSLPILLRWHHLLLVLCWNFTMTLFFLPGKPSLLMAMTVASLGISLFQRALSSEKRFISAPRITWPLICLTGVVLFTAKMTGGIGLHALGSDVWGGRKYIYLLSGIAAYFAITARRIPIERAGLYIALFFLGSLTSTFGDLVNVLPSAFRFIFLLIPPDFGVMTEGLTRFGGVSVTAAALFSLMLARYGMRGIFFSGKLWRPIALVLFFLLTFFGGFRSTVTSLVFIFLIQFFMQRMHKTKLLPVFMFLGIAVAVAVVPLAGKLPGTFQRVLSFLPLNIDPAIRMQAEGSSDWRWLMVKALAPQIPKYLLLGKGYAFAGSDLESAGNEFHAISADNWSSAVAGDYHNGPLSVILPFGIWGVIGFLWFQIASLRALHANFRYGDERLKNVNAFLFAAFLTHMLIFWSPVFGDLASDMTMYAGLIGLGISLNGGVVKRPAKAPAAAPVEKNAPAFVRPPFRPAFTR